MALSIQKALLAACVVGATLGVACGSSDEESGGASGDATGAKKFYLEKVNDSVQATCNSCHQTGKSGSPIFLGTSGESSYIAIEGFPGLIAPPNLSPFLQKGPHSGPALTSVQSALVDEWLKLEVKERKLTNDPGVPKNLRAAFKAFGDCMDYEKWIQFKLHTLANVETDGNQGQCKSCHNYGQASLWLSGGRDNVNDPNVARNDPDNARTFMQMRQFPYVQRLVVGRVTAEGTFDTVEPARRIIDKGTEAQQLQANSHPRFALPSDLTLALTNYVLETLSNMSANRCAGVTGPDANLLDAPSNNR